MHNDSLVVATSHHGQTLKEKGIYGDGTFMHDEILRVPSIVKYLGGEKSRPGSCYQPLRRVQEVVKDWFVEVHDGSSLSTDHAVAVSFGIPNGPESVSDVPDFETERARFDRPRKAVYKDGLKLVVDGREGIIEEFSRAGKPLGLAGAPRK